MGEARGWGFLGGGVDTRHAPGLCVASSTSCCVQARCVCVCVFARAREHGLVCVHAHICLYSYVSAKSELYVWLPSSPPYACIHLFTFIHFCFHAHEKVWRRHFRAKTWHKGWEGGGGLHVLPPPPKKEFASWAKQPPPPPPPAPGEV